MIRKYTDQPSKRIQNKTEPLGSKTSFHLNSYDNLKVLYLY